MLWRFSRQLDARHFVQLDMRSRVGDWGEEHAAEIIRNFMQHEYGAWLRSPILPLGAGRERESDFLVYTKGKLFCIEIKNFRGTIMYNPNGYHGSKMLYYKRGNYGEYIPPKEFDNPLQKTRSFIRDLKKHLERIDKRFSRFPILPVAGFTQGADISAIYDWHAGIIQVEQLPDFFKSHQDHRFARQPSDWIIDTILKKVPTWDWVVTTYDQRMGGRLLDSQLVFLGTDRQWHSLPYRTISSISWQRGTFSPYDLMKVNYSNGTSQVFESVKGEVRLSRGKNTYIHKTRNLKELTVGLANKYSV